MSAKGQTIIQVMERLAPKYLAEPEDRIGLQLGTLQKDVDKVLIALDVNEAVVDEAIQLGANMIIAHHAIIYRPLKSLQTDTPAGKLYEKCMKHDIAVYVAHTNLDVAPGGINDMMAAALALDDVQVLSETFVEPLYKLVVFVPASHKDNVLQAMFAAGAGAIGQYSHCSFQLEGTGTFMPGDGTEPFIGKQGQIERVEETRVETIVPQHVCKKVVQAMLKAHPYEEVAYDLYPLELQGERYGLGRVGRLPESQSLASFAKLVKQAFDVPTVRVVGDLERKVRKVAVLGGSGGKFVRDAIFAGADVLVTGDIDYHTAQDAEAAGIALVDPGHHAEKIMKQGVADYLRDQFSTLKMDVAVFASAVHTEPFQFL